MTYSEIAIRHKKEDSKDPDRNLRIYQKMLAEGKILEPRQQYYYGRELYYHQLYEDAVSVFEKFLESSGGWLEIRLKHVPSVLTAIIT